MREMSKDARVREYFLSGLWSERMVRDAVKKGWIDERDAEEIFGEVARGVSPLNF